MIHGNNSDIPVSSLKVDANFIKVYLRDFGQKPGKIS